MKKVHCHEFQLVDKNCSTGCGFQPNIQSDSWAKAPSVIIPLNPRTEVRGNDSDNLSYSRNQLVLRTAACLLLAVGLASCAASIAYRTDYPLTGGLVQSRDGILHGSIPEGWFSSTDDTLGSALTILLMNDDISAALTVKELKLDQRSAEEVERQGLKLLARLSAGYRPGEPANESGDFELGGKRFSSYEFEEKGMRKRVVVFSARKKFYECEAAPVRRAPGGDEYAKMFSVQQSFLSSLTY